MSESDRPAEGCGICAAIANLRRGGESDFVAELPQNFVALAWQQFYRGYCVLFAKRHVTELFHMPRNELRELYDEVTAVAESIAEVTRPWKMNYACLGNVEPHVHWHLIPRYQSDPRRTEPIWVRPDREIRVALSERDRSALIAALREQIKSRIGDARIA
ncbi:MAG TPA: HIT family protein [Candidatus Binataceae bacterium]|nr:HIT family protein [Candidatus Binataceae bacterium]